MAAALVWAVMAPQAPYVSCINGYIAPTLADCPKTLPGSSSHSPYGDGPAPRGGGGRSDGLLGGLLGGLF